MKTLKTPLFIALLTIVIWLVVANHSDSNTIYKKGQQAFQQRDYSKALREWQQGLVVAQKKEDQVLRGKLLAGMGLAYAELNQYEKAKNSTQAALAIHKMIGSKRELGGDYINLAGIYLATQQYHQAMQFYQYALTLSRALGDQQRIGFILGNMASLYRQKEDYNNALDLYQQAIKIHEATTSKEWLGLNHHGIGLTYQAMDKPEQAIKHYQQALVFAEETDNPRTEAEVLASLGGLYVHLGQYEKAIITYTRSLNIHQKLRNRRGIGTAFSELGLVHSYLSDSTRALNYYQKALPFQRETQDKNGESVTLHNLGALFFNLGQNPQALQYYEAALLIQKKLHNASKQSEVLTSIGVVHAKDGAYKAALQCYESVLKLHNQSQAVVKIRILINICSIYHKMNNHQKALQYCQQALSMTKQKRSPRTWASLLAGIGAIHIALKKHKSALIHLNKSYQLFKRLGLNQDIWPVQYGLATLAENQQQWKTAILHYRATLTTIESLRTRLQKDDRIAFTQDKLYVYDQFIRLLVDLHRRFPGAYYGREALAIFERKQGRVLLEDIGKSGARRFAGIPAQVIDDETALTTQINKLENDLNISKSKADNHTRQNQIKVLEHELTNKRTVKLALDRQISKRYPRYSALTNPQPANLTQLQQHTLQHDEAMLVYAVLQDQTFLWVVSHDVVHLVSLSTTRTELSNDIRNLRQLIGVELKNDETLAWREPQIWQVFAKQSHKLYKTLLPKSVQQYLAGKSVIYIVPTGPLYRLPFGLLLTQPTTKQKNASYFISHYATTYLSSASLLKLMRSNKIAQKPARYPFLAFANPVFKHAEKAEAMLNLRTKAYRQILGSDFDELPETEDEAREIAALLSAPDVSEPLQLRNQASRTGVFKLNQSNRLQQYRYILFATHGVLPGEIDSINQPALILSHPDPENGSGFLTMEDVFQLKLNAHLVSISACNTGMGKHEQGEGIIGLTRAFMYAGSQAVMVTLWAVESTAAKHLSVEVFRNLQGLSNAAKSLQKVKQSMLRHNDYAHPLFWAPSIIFGDPDIPAI